MNMIRVLDPHGRMKYMGLFWNVVYGRGQARATDLRDGMKFHDRADAFEWAQKYWAPDWYEIVTVDQNSDEWREAFKV